MPMPGHITFTDDPLGDNERQHSTFMAAHALKKMMEPDNKYALAIDVSSLMKHMIDPLFQRFARELPEIISLLGDKTLVYNDLDEHWWVRDGKLFYRNADCCELETIAVEIPDKDPPVRGVAPKYYSIVFKEEPHNRNKDIALFGFDSLWGRMKVETVYHRYFTDMWRFLENAHFAYLILKDAPCDEGGTHGKFVNEFRGNYPYDAEYDGE